MGEQAKTVKQLLQENELLRDRLEEAEAALEAIRSGGVDALVVSSSEGDQVFTLQGAEHPYRVMVETMNEGAATLLEDGTILYANPRLAAILGEPLETLAGSSILDFIEPEDSEIFEGLVEQGFRHSSKAEIRFLCSDRSQISVFVSLSPTQVQGAQALCLVATDLTEQKRSDEIVAAERLARSILDQAGEVILVCDADGKIMRANHKALRTFSRIPIYKPFEEAFPLIYHHPDGNGSSFSITRVLGGESFQEIEVEYPSRQGGNRFFLLSAAPLLQIRGQIIGCIVTLTEMTERKRMEDRLAFQAKLLEHVHDAIIATDTHLVITAWNQAAEKQYGWKAEEVTGQGIGQVIRSEYSDQQRQEAVQELNEKGYYRVEVVQYTRDGRRIIAEGDTIVLRDGAGKISGYVSASRDITERKQVEEMIQSYAAQLERSNQELQDFAFIASHDLQEPLRKIEGFSKHLENRTYLEETDREYLQRMLEAAQRMRKMIDDLLELSRVTTRSQPYEPVDLNQAASMVVDDLGPRIRKAKGQVIVQPLPVIDADPTQMHQLLQNLVGNAVKYHRPETPPVVQVGAKEHSPGWVEITVQDNGIGFEMKYLDQIFQPFRRLHGRGEYEGSGIGLALCRKIVERHGGKITAKSVPGEGSTFSVVLPVRHARDE